MTCIFHYLILLLDFDFSLKSKIFKNCDEMIVFLLIQEYICNMLSFGSPCIIISLISLKSYDCNLGDVVYLVADYFLSIDISIWMADFNNSYNLVCLKFI